MKSEDLECKQTFMAFFIQQFRASCYSHNLSGPLWQILEHYISIIALLDEDFRMVGCTFFVLKKYLSCWNNHVSVDF